MFWHYIDRKWWFFTILSIIYLYFESSFAISLLEAVRNDTIHTLEDMDKVGRILSGVGAAILVCQAVAHSKLERKWRYASLLSLIAFGGVYKAQEEAVSLLELYTPLYIKEQVYNGYTFHRAATSGAYDLYKARFSGVGVPSYVETAFWGTYGFHSMFNRGTRNEATAQRIAHKVFQNDFNANSNFYYQKYKKANLAVSQALNGYFEIKKEVEKEVNRNASDAYERVLSEYKNLPRYIRRTSNDEVMSKIRERVKAEAGFSLPRNWKINDRIGFVYHFMKHHKATTIPSETSRVYKDKTGIVVSGEIENKHELFRTKGFQKKLANDVELFYTSEGFLRNLTKEQFVDKYQISVPTNLAKLYKNGKESEKTLNMVFKLSVIPLLAISFSLVFLTLNFCSLAYSLFFEMVYLGEKRFSANVVKVSIFASVVVLPIYMTNAINTDPFFLTNLELLEDATSPEFGLFYSWIVAMSMNVTSLIGNIHINLLHI
ncbi:hypothetical protein [Vibrio sp. D431a]|uniref:hypothetical protein n=1 Tax=Vibrio sp. D431a TaxID=2837388 RepID=UPI002556A4E2|nr:hypothetical protein [Vibrio sp. D431a]MDK9790168.1 hypothetical protein [Vibrio sp. D431a]